MLGKGLAWCARFGAGGLPPYSAAMAARFRKIENSAFRSSRASAGGGARTAPTSPEAMASDFQHQQRAFTAHVRDPNGQPRPAGIPPRRMAVYVELLFNNLNGQLSTNFPVLRAITPDAAWRSR